MRIRPGVISATERAARVYEELEKTFGRQPTSREVGAHMGIGMHAARAHLAAARGSGRISEYEIRPGMVQAHANKATVRGLRALDDYIKEKLDFTRVELERIMKENRMPPNHYFSRTIALLHRDLMRELANKKRVRREMADALGEE